MESFGGKYDKSGVFSSKLINRLLLFPPPGKKLRTEITINRERERKRERRVIRSHSIEQLIVLGIDPWEASINWSGISLRIVTSCRWQTWFRLGATDDELEMKEIFFSKHKYLLKILLRYNISSQSSESRSEPQLLWLNPTADEIRHYMRVHPTENSAKQNRASKRRDERQRVFLLHVR